MVMVLMRFYSDVSAAMTESDVSFKVVMNQNIMNTSSDDCIKSTKGGAHWSHISLIVRLLHSNMTRA